MMKVELARVLFVSIGLNPESSEIYVHNRKSSEECKETKGLDVFTGN
jgi:hypothetical protein